MKPIRHKLKSRAPRREVGDHPRQTKTTEDIAARTSFLALPFELRKPIYQQVIGRSSAGAIADQRGRLRSKTPFFAYKPALSLLLICKTIHDEALEIFYERTVLLIQPGISSAYLPRARGYRSPSLKFLQNIQYLEILPAGHGVEVWRIRCRDFVKLKTILVYLGSGYKFWLPIIPPGGFPSGTTEMRLDEVRFVKRDFTNHGFSDGSWVEFFAKLLLELRFVARDGHPSQKVRTASYVSEHLILRFDKLE